MTQQAPLDRRPYLTEPGDPLLLPDSPIEHSLVYARYQAHTGVPHVDMHTSTLVTVPVPMPPVGGFTEGRRWPNTRAEMMWHPLMWLPDWVTARYEFDGRRESDDEMSVRICLQLMECGLYDPASGTWADTLAEAGLDVDSPSDVERVRRWLAGGDDSLLDALAEDVSDIMDSTPMATPEIAEHLDLTMPELEDLVRGHDELQMHRLARQHTPVLREASWTLAAESLLDALTDMASGEVREGASPVDENATDWAWAPGSRRDLTDAFVQLAQDFLRGSEQAPRLAHHATALADFNGDDDALLAGPVAALSELLEEVRHRYQATLDALIKGAEVEAGAEEGVPAT